MNKASKARGMRTGLDDKKENKKMMLGRNVFADGSSGLQIHWIC